MSRAIFWVASFACFPFVGCASGDECTSAAECASGMCLNGHCTEPPAADAGATDSGVGADAGADAGSGTGVDAALPADSGVGADAGADAGSGTGVDAGAGVDAGRDAGAAAGVDAGRDAGSDAGPPPPPIDAGPPAGCSFVPVTSCPATGRIADFCGAGATVMRLRRCDASLYTPTADYLLYNLCACGCACSTGVVWSEVECCY